MAKTRYVLAIDQGTTGTHVSVLDHKLKVVGKAYREFRQIFPKPGWVEHDLEEIWTSVLQTQALRTLAAGLRAVGAEPELGERAAALADATEDAIHHELITDDVLPGYVLTGEGGSREG